MSISSQPSSVQPLSIEVNIQPIFIIARAYARMR